MKRAIAFSCLLLSFAAISTPADAAEKGWRYWGYFQTPPHSTQWITAMTGPTTTLRDGAIEGWKFTLSSNSIAAKPPTTSPRFAKICSGVTREDGVIRVGLIVDFGSSLISPRGEKPRTTIVRCVKISEGSTGLDVLQQELKVRQSSQGFICALNQYPAQECSAEIKVPTQLRSKN